MKTKLATAEQKPEDGRKKMNGVLGIVLRGGDQELEQWS